MNQQTSNRALIKEIHKLGIKKNKISVFVLITYLMTILFHIMLQLLGGKSNPITLNLLGIPMIIPFVSVIIVKKGIFKEDLKSSLGISLRLNQWYIYAVFMTILMAFLMNISGTILFGSGEFMLKDILKISLINIGLGLSIASVSAFFEEVTWRGFVHHELKHLGIIKSSLIIGTVWSAWHIPVAIWYKYSDSPLKGAAINCLQLFLLSLIISYIRYKAESVIAATLIHGVLNTLFLSSSAVFFTVKDTFNIEWTRVLTVFLTLVLIGLYEQYSHKVSNKVPCR